MKTITKTYQIQLDPDPATVDYLKRVGKESAIWMNRAYRMLYSDKRNNEWQNYGPDIEQYNDNTGSYYPPIIYEKANSKYKVNHRNMYPAFIVNEETRIQSTLPVESRQLLSIKVAQTYENFLNNVISPKTIPYFKPIICYKFYKYNYDIIDKSLVGVILNIKKDKRIIKIKQTIDPKYKKHLNEILNKFNKPIQIIQHEDKKWYAHIPVTIEVPEVVKQPKKIMGIDVGIRNSMTGVIVIDNKTLPTQLIQDPGPKIFNRLEHTQKRIRSLRSKADKGNKNCRKALKRLKGKRRLIRQTMMRQMTAKYVKIAKQNGVEGIAIEDLRGMKPDLSKKMNRLITQWGRFENANFIKFKSTEYGLNCKLIEPRGTSTTCPRCFVKDKNSRKGKTFKCVKCGFTLDSDVVGAINIARRGYNYWNSPKWANSQSSVATPVIAETPPAMGVGGLSPPMPSDAAGQSGNDSVCDKPTIGTNGAVDYVPRSPPMRSGGILSQPENVSEGKGYKGVESSACMEVEVPGAARPGKEPLPEPPNNDASDPEKDRRSNPDLNSYRKEILAIETSESRGRN